MTTSNPQSLLKTVLEKEASDSRTSAAGRLASLVSSKAVTLNWIVETLGPQLTSDDDAERSNGTRALVDVISRAEDVGATPSRVLVAFFADRAEDVACQPEIIRGLHALCCSATAHPDALSETAGAIVSGVLAHLAPGTLSPESRRLAVEVLSAAALRAGTAGADAASAAMRLRGLFVGEREPRILRGALILLARLARAAGPQHVAPVARELFDSFSAYFPVLFVPRPAPGTPPECVVSKEELVTALRLCFASSPAFAPLAVPFLLDKTASSIAASRADAFLTLAAVARASGIDACGDGFADKVREAIEANGLPCDGEAAHDAIAALSYSMLELLPPTSAPVWLARLSERAAALVAQAEKPEAEFDKDASDGSRKLLARLSSHVVGVECTPRVAAELARSRPARPAIVVPAMADIAVALRSAPPTPASPVFVASAAEFLCRELVSSLGTPAAMLADVGRGLAALSEIKAFPDAGITEGVAALTALAVGRERPELTRAEAAESLAGIGGSRPAIIVAKALPPLLAVAGSDASALRALPKLSAAHNVLFRGIVAQLADVVAPLLASGGDGAPLLGALRDSIRDGRKDDAESVSLCRSTALRLAQIVCSLPQEKPPPASAVTACRIIVRSVVESAPAKEQLELIRNLEGLFVRDGSIPLLAASPLFSAAVASVSRQNAAAVSGFIPALLSLAEAAGAPTASKDAAALAAASVANKLGPESEAILDSTAQKASGSRFPGTLAWMARGLLMKGHPRGQAFLSSLLSLCTESAEAAKYVGVVSPQTCPVDEGLVERSGAISVGGLSERVFAIAFVPLAEQHARDPSRVWPRVAISHVLASAPASSLEANAARCVPIALAVLDCTVAAIDEASAAAALAMVASLASAAPNLLGDHVENIAMKLVAVATSQRHTARSRAAALEALLAIRYKVPEYKTLPHQQAIVIALQPALDDPKRAVRSVAVRCRNAWTIFQ